MALSTDTQHPQWPVHVGMDWPHPIRPQPVLNLRSTTVGLGPLSRDLMPVYTRWLNDFEMLAMLDRRFRPLTPGWIETWYERQARGSADSMVFTMWDIATSTPIGNVAFQDIDMRSRTAEFGIFIAEPTFRNGGRGTEATRLMTCFGFESLALENIMLRAFAHNTRAIRVYRRVGFRVIGERRNARLHEGSREHVIFMDMTRDDYEQSKLGFARD